MPVITPELPVTRRSPFPVVLVMALSVVPGSVFATLVNLHTCGFTTTTTTNTTVGYRSLPKRRHLSMASEGRGQPLPKIVKIRLLNLRRALC